jgi:hypothetical protein
MKNKLLVSITLLIVGVFIAVGPQTIFKVCDGSKMQMKCYWSSRAEIGIGLILVVLGVLYLLLEQWQAKIAICILGITTGIIAILIPTILIGGCADKMMVCQSLSFPAIYLISVVTIIAALGNSIYIFRKRNKQ